MYNNIDNSNKEATESYRRIKEKRAKQQRKMKIIKLSACIILILAVVTVVVKGTTSSNTDNIEIENIVAVDDGNVQREVVTEPQPQGKKVYPYPEIINSYMQITSATVRSPYLALLDVENNQIIAGRDCERRIYPASMTKVMTLIVAVEKLKRLDTTFTMTSDIVSSLMKQQASRAGFDPGEIVDANNLLYGLILPSGADAAVALADMIAGSEEEFVNLMNSKCEELGLKNTHFVNTSGLQDINHYTTPIEMAMIMDYAMKNEICAKILSTYQYTTTPTVQHPEGILLTSNMFSKMYGNEVQGMRIIAGKTGYTDQSGNCLVSYAEKNGRHYVVVIAGGGSAWNVIFDDFDIFKNYTPVIG
ncbi:D-alanyl-D-alanine carboxypeptidase family protein [[Clostridium] fimetarium]|uniref:D-alanyl-D-alanine carboxypeptidase (Penicillin-binding protein 5/6) n=1 Tax=[Clostridium] fimetarium TaxID=99656 RepID=A0A1I0M5R2_9FIRM|nr:serine hydrolase [[Clostridium] fimetarium]SEV83815.1 D-alanyl-D-alanine carboxypeptidase (penicillin-binding protein 5/6) [[Clostridium] fimetarium]